MDGRSATRQRFRAMFLAQLDKSRARIAALPLDEPASASVLADVLHQLIGSTSAVDLVELGILCRYCEQRLRALERAGFSPAAEPASLKILGILDDISEALHSDRAPDMTPIRALSERLAPDAGG